MVKESKTNDAENVVKQTTTDGTETNLNYLQVLPMTFEERYKMYMRCKKEELAKMLAERDRIGIDYPWPPQPLRTWPPLCGCDISYPNPCCSLDWNTICSTQTGQSDCTLTQKQTTEDK
jgi:hypothetical protein